MTKTTTTVEHDPAGEVLDAALTIAGRILLGSFVLIWRAVLFPMVTVPVLGIVAAWVLIGWPAGVGVAGGTVAGMVLWRRWSPQTFERWFTGRARSRFLAWHRYRRRWAKMLTACDLATRDGDRVMVPRLVSVQIGNSTDIVRTRMLPGHSPESWTNRTDHLAHGFGAQQAVIRFAGPGLVEIAFRRSDALSDPVVVPFESLAGFKTIPGTGKAA